MQIDIFILVLEISVLIEYEKEGREERGKEMRHNTAETKIGLGVNTRKLFLE